MVMLPTLSFHHQLLDYCLQAKKMLCLICLGQTVSAACISICCESLDLQCIYMSGFVLCALVYTVLFDPVTQFICWEGKNVPFISFTAVNWRDWPGRRCS